MCRGISAPWVVALPAVPLLSVWPESVGRAPMGACSTDLWLDTSTNGLKHVCTSTQEIYEKTYFLENIHTKIIYNFYNTSFCLKQHNALKWHFYLKKLQFSENLQYISI
jgi:hypothetical protein